MWRAVTEAAALSLRRAGSAEQLAELQPARLELVALLLEPAHLVVQRADP